MSKLFWIPFATGIFHGVAKEQNKPPQWGITSSILVTNALYSTAIRLVEEYTIKPDVSKYVANPMKPYVFLSGTFGASLVFAGSFFCVGHLVTKKAYPVLKDAIN